MLNCLVFWNIYNQFLQIYSVCYWILFKFLNGTEMEVKSIGCINNC